jgi:hypothetical protein
MIDVIVRRRRADHAHVRIELVTRREKVLRSKIRLAGGVEECGEGTRSGREDFGFLLETVLLPSRIAFQSVHSWF